MKHLWDGSSMNMAGPTCERISPYALLCLVVLFWGTGVHLNGQDRPSAPGGDGQTKGAAEKSFTIRIGVEEVRLDAVVLDKKGHQITDLTAEDFEIYQDYFRQKVTSCVYIDDYRPRSQKAGVSSKTPGLVPQIPAPALAREDVRRTIVFVVDNLTMDFTQVERARTALRKFVETQMQEGDLASIVPTAGGNAEFQTFSSDKQHLLKMIQNVRWFIDTRIAPITPQMLAMAYSIRTLRDMPGRKALVMVSPATMIPSPLLTSIGVWLNSAARAVEYTDATFNPLADAALRAGVVIHTLDIKGLSGPFSIDAAQGFDYSLLDESGTLDPGQVQEKASKAVAVRDTETPIPLSKKTGGLFIRDSNWFVDGIGPVQEELKGYYMLTYSPPPSTFRLERRNMYHRVQIKAKRPGCEVHARDGFFGVPSADQIPEGLSNSLYTAIFSPFQYNDLKINLSSGYIEDLQKGYLLQSALHMDAQNLSITEGKDGNNSIVLETASVTSDINNVIRDSNSLQFQFAVKKENTQWFREHGLKFSLRLPVKKPGIYYVRTAVRDPVSGKMGSAYQYIEIPDLNKNRLALSSIFVINRSEDLPWTASRAPVEFRTQLYPDLRKDPRKSPALKSYRPGDTIECAAMIYNAKAEKGRKPDLESQFVLYANGHELFKSEPEAVDVGSLPDLKRIPIKIRLHLTDSIQTGEYILQLQVRDKQAKQDQNLAVQILDFKVSADREKEAAEAGAR